MKLINSGAHAAPAGLANVTESESVLGVGIFFFIFRFGRDVCVWAADAAAAAGPWALQLNRSLSRCVLCVCTANSLFGRHVRKTRQICQRGRARGGKHCWLAEKPFCWKFYVDAAFFCIAGHFDRVSRG